LKGKLQVETVASQVLKGNPLGDPHIREVPVYLPPSYGKARGRRYPFILFLPGFTGGGRTLLAYHPWKETLPERFDRLIAAGKAEECVLAIADCFTALGGSQYLNSPATGRYEDHVLELVEYFTDKFGLIDAPESRALLGKSSGGYGALMLGMKHPDVWAHVGSHSGDMLFEISFAADLPKAARKLAKYGGDPAKVLREFRSSRKKDEFDHCLLNVLAMAACYSPRGTGFELPIDVRTALKIPAVWKRWLALDPVEAAPRFAKNLKKLKTLFFDAGAKDEWFLDFGARRLSAVLKKLGVRHIHEEHAFGHRDMNDRYDRSLALLSARLSR
jgi:enterochelin esterase family protein